MSSIIKVRIVGDNKGLSGVLDDSESRIGKFAAAAGAIAAAGALAAGAAVVKGAFAAIDFDSRMREVFTLLPGISAPAMDDMKGQVKDFSTAFGVLPDKVIPALYQAISAGVPQDNVFAFLETAQKAAKGGVAELQTAVDGISSVVNAYGTEVMSATEASDLMFTAVRLGKTDFNQLSASLFQVTPTASGLGVEFGDVTAALATLTAQGVPTSVATTQMRQLFVELSKEGGKAAGTFEGLAGKSFKDFIAAGGNTAEALDVMLAGAEGLGVGVNDLFGSVEAGSAALMLAGSDVFVANTAAMADSAGATDAAFEMMNGGLRPLIDRLKAFGQVALIEIGERVVPQVEKFIALIQRNWPQIQSTVRNVMAAISSAWSRQGAPVFAAIVAAGVAVVGFFRRVWPDVQRAVATVFDWITNNKDVVVGALTGLAVAVAAVLVPAFVAWAGAATAAAAATLVAAAPFIAVGVALAAIGAAAVWAYQNVDWFRDAVDTVAQFFTGTVWPILQETWQVIRDVVSAIVGFIRENWDTIQTVITTVFDEVRGYVETIWGTIYGIVDGYITTIKGIIQTVMSLIRGDWAGVWDGIKQIVDGVWTVIKSLISGAINVVVGFITAIPGRIFGVAWTMFNAISDNMDMVRDWVKERAEDFLGYVLGLPGRLVGKFVGMWDGIKDSFRSSLNWVIQAWNDLSFTMPSVSVFGQTVGGWTLSTPNIPKFHDGGIVPGPRGSEMFALLEAGERVTSVADVAREGRSGGPITLIIEGRPFSAMLADHDQAQVAALMAGAR